MNTQTLQKWNVSTLGNTIDIIDGDRGKNYPKQNEFLDSGYCLFLSTKNVPSNIFSFEEKMFITKEKDLALRKGKLERGDFVLTTRGTVGNFAYYSEKVPFENVRLNSGMVIMRIRKNGKLLPGYFKFYLDSPLFKGQVKSRSSGSAQPQLPIRDLSVFEIEIPDIQSQQHIFDFLSTYDGLIENNTRRIQILEQMAQAIYTEWFVNFRFPGYENVKIIDSKTDFGKIPEGWRIGRLSDLANITMGQSPSSDFYNETGEGLPFHQGVTNFGFRFPATTTFSTGGTRRASTGDILFSVRAPVGRINVADRDMIIGRGLSTMRSTSETQSYFLYALKNLFATEDLIGGGAIFASVTKADLNNFPVAIPDAKVIGLFEKEVNPLDVLIFNLSHSLSILRRSRDLLLPKLVTGEIRV